MRRQHLFGDSDALASLDLAIAGKPAFWKQRCPRSFMKSIMQSCTKRGCMAPGTLMSASGSRKPCVLGSNASSLRLLQMS